MFQKMIQPKLILWIPIAAVLATGCDDRAAHVAREAADRQAQQNTTMAELNKEVAGGAHRLVEADAQARREMVGVHRDLLAERTRLDTGWSALEDERRQIAGQRRTESTLLAASQVVGAVLLVVTLLGFCWYVLVAARSDTISDPELQAILVDQVIAADATLLPASDGRTNVPQLKNSAD
jgi:hypothetical protein